MRKPLMIIVALLLLVGCGAGQYGEIQTNFDKAVQEDNVSVDSAGSGYAEILAQLTPAEIAQLDAKLQPNAWMMRAFSAWRTGDLADAKSAADAGLALDPPPQSRDQVVLMSVYGLIAETEAQNAWRNVPESQRDKSLYEAHEGKLALAWDKLSQAEKEVGPESPPNLSSYVHYHKWRTAANWAGIISGCAACTADERNAMRETAASSLDGMEPQEAADAERDKTNGQLRDLIRAQGGG